ncbi:hypothetical protein ABZ654_12130 [Streptomyces hygroscopicus]|uniref:Uncharacterized protein n=2 Tax=Streptomyces TaxID=1883 RepID=A0ABT9L191_9ACTN|nr:MULTISPECIES: hypothetical protein [Streptomyces]MCO8304889.1 hypothetical protein [Streptomyces sp. RKCA744]MDN3060107.1 hypothetical protein [Streptomyces sp. SRF1]MDP9614473.1 hypothetical protein [Streptomyces demainii]GHJ32355.1 hypothetical protein TPA0910_67880 [Streptomyces hygroscopicus]
MTHMFLNGQAMKAGLFHHRLQDAPLVRKTRTAPCHRALLRGVERPAGREVN